MSKLAALQKRQAQLIKTLETASAKFNKAQADLTALNEQLAAVSVTAAIENAVNAGLPAGTAVDFVYGRADTKQTLQGIVVGSKPQEKGPTLYRISVGEGFDQQLFNVTGAAIRAHNYNPVPTDDTLAFVDGGAQ
jgi:hypothetical protein